MAIDLNLRAGWEPDTPVEDSFLRRFLVNRTASIEAHEISLGAGGELLHRWLYDLASWRDLRKLAGERAGDRITPD
jgi:hypothetical protein